MIDILLILVVCICYSFVACVGALTILNTLGTDTSITDIPVIDLFLWTVFWPIGFPLGFSLMAWRDRKSKKALDEYNRSNQ